MILLAVVIVLLFFLFMRLLSGNRKKMSEESAMEKDSTLVTGKRDTSGYARDTILTPDTSEIAPKKSKPKKHAPVIPKDTIKTDTVKPGPETSDDLDTLAFTKPSDPCLSDTSPPWVYPDPSGGLHRGATSIKFVANRPVRIEWRFETDSEWKLYSGSPVMINATSTVLFQAIDSCGRKMEIREEFYEIEPKSLSVCPDNMEHVKVGNSSFCIDRYEWPNREGATPLSYISLYHAMDSCFAVGKRLCTKDEWTLACSGPYTWKYPYGQNYEPYACATHESGNLKAGSRPECRSYFGVFDMSGGVLEWTSTVSTENRNFYNVMGGFWESGPRSSCNDSKYSYFPQNRHNPVGFRCCMDAPESIPGSLPQK